MKQKSEKISKSVNTVDEVIAKSSTPRFFLRHNVYCVDKFPQTGETDECLPISDVANNAE